MIRGIQQHGSPYGSFDSAYESTATSTTTPTVTDNAYTIIMIDDDANDTCNERTALLSQQKQRAWHGQIHCRNFGSIQSMPHMKGYDNDSDGAKDSQAGYQNTNNSQTYIHGKNCNEKSVCDVRLVLFGGFLLTSLMIATYLLIIESRIPSIGFSLDLVNRDIWSKMSLERVLNHANVQNVLVMQTNGQTCNNSDSCIEALQRMQMAQQDEEKGAEIPYNFLIGSDGQTYEVRGWDYESGNAMLPQNKTLVIGFIGDYTKRALSTVQQQSASSLINESVKRNKLQKDYDVYGLRNDTISLGDSELLIQAVAKWPRYKTQLHVT